MVQDNRINAYDTLKTIAIFLVVFYHVGKLDIDFLTHQDPMLYFNYFFYGLSSMGVPLFFMVNGALLLNKKTYDLKKHAIKTISIFILLLVWGSLSLLFFSLIYKEQLTLAQFIQNLIQLKSGRIDYLWFLKALIYLYILFPLVKALYDQNRSYAFYMMLVVFFFTFSHLPYIDWINPFQAYYSYALVYFMLGAFLANHANDHRIKNSTLYALFFVSALALFGWGIYKSSQVQKMYDTVWEGYDTVFTLFMVSALFIGCKRIAVKASLASFIGKIGACTLGIYFIHLLLSSAITLLFPFTQTNLLVALVYSVAILLMSFLLTWLCQKIPLVKRLFALT